MNAIFLTHNITPFYPCSQRDEIADLIKDSETTVNEFSDKRASLKNRNFKLVSQKDFSAHVLSRASSLGNVNLIRFIFQEYGPKVLEWEDKGRTPLHQATGKHHYEAISELICLGSAINKTTSAEGDYDYNPYHSPPPNEKHTLKKMRLEVTIPAGATSLDIAIKTNCLTIAILLLLYKGKTQLPLSLVEQSMLESAHKHIANTRNTRILAVDYAIRNTPFPAALLQLIADYSLCFP